MSRVGKKIRIIPAGVSAELRGRTVFVKGPKGELHLDIPYEATVAIDSGQIVVSVKNENDKKQRSLWGTISSIINNMIVGVTVGFKKELEINGVGYKVAMKGTNLNLEVGLSHSVEVKPLPGVKFSVDKNIITIEGFDKQAVGEMAATIRAIRKPEPYKGKGIKYTTETIRRKAGKTATKSAA